MEENLLAASLVPLHMMEKAAETLELLEVLGEKGSRMAVSDVGVAVQFARTGIDWRGHECVYQHQVHEEPGKRQKN